MTIEESELREKIKKLERESIEFANITSSIIRTGKRKIDKLSADAILTNYGNIWKLSTLYKLFNENFYDKEIKQKEKKLDKEIKEYHEMITFFMTQ